MFQFKSAFSSNSRRLGIFDCFNRVANTIVAVYPFDFVPAPIYTGFLGERVLGSMFGYQKKGCSESTA